MDVAGLHLATFDKHFTEPSQQTNFYQGLDGNVPIIFSDLNKGAPVQALVFIF